MTKMKKIKKQRKIPPKEIKRFDPILKEIISHSIGKVIELATGEKLEAERKVKFLPEEIRFLKTLRADFLLEVSNKIFHLEIQAQQDKTLPERMFEYSYAIRGKYGKEPIQIILFVGKGKPPPPVFKSKYTTHSFIVLDMKEVSPDLFIRSDKPEEVILAILTGKFKEKYKIIKDVIEKIAKIEKREEKIIKYIDGISFLASLFDIKIKLELKSMPIQVDITKTFLYKEGEKRGIQKGLKEGEQRGILKGIKEGLREGLKEAIAMVVLVKFGQLKSKQVKKLLENIDDIKQLKKIKKEVIMVKRWDEFIKVLRNSQSKKINSK
jgi:predicted transposase YdaD